MKTAWPGIVRLVERLLAWPGSSSEVEDVAQEVFLAAWRTRSTFRGEAAWETWVYAIAVQRARNAARARKRRQRWFGLVLPNPEDVRAAGPDHFAAAERSSDALSGPTRDALGAMSHSDRELIVLRYLEEQSVEEIMRYLQLTRAAADARLSRARARLKKLLDAGSGQGAEQ